MTEKYAKGPGTEQDQSFAPFAHESQATSFGRRKLATTILSAVCRVLRNSLRAAIQDNLYPHYTQTILTQWPANDRPLRCDLDSAGVS